MYNHRKYREMCESAIKEGESGVYLHCPFVRRPWPCHSFAWCVPLLKREKDRYVTKVVQIQTILSEEYTYNMIKYSSRIKNCARGGSKKAERKEESRATELVDSKKDSKEQGGHSVFSGEQVEI